MREHRKQASVGRAVNRSFSFCACCELRCLRLANGTRDAKDFEFDHMHTSQPASDFCLNERESVALPSVEARREFLSNFFSHAAFALRYE